MKTTIISLTVLFFLLNTSCAQENNFPYSYNSKKIVAYQGSTYMDWAPDVVENLESMQTNRPFVDGVVFHIGPKYGEAIRAFSHENWTEESLFFEDLKKIKSKSKRFTDNFILVWGDSKDNPDFFNDTIWTKIISNTILLGKAVKTAGCKGIDFDPEFYSREYTYSPWWYRIPPNEQKESKFKGTPPYLKNGKTYEETKAKARQRGKEYVVALQKHMPEITILTTFLYSAVWDYCYGDITKLPGSSYALLGAFADGMFEGLNPGSTIMDGNEAAYYIDETRKYFDNSDNSNYGFVRTEAPSKVCDSNALKNWNAQGQVGFSFYQEECCNQYGPQKWSTPEYQAKWLTHNVYNSLLATDQYVWAYIEEMNFWTGENAPPGVDAVKCISTAVEKFRKGEALGYDMWKNASDFKFQDDKQAEFVASPTVKLTVAKSAKLGNKTITATIKTDISILKVEFYANSLKIGEDTTPPYSFTKEFSNAGYLIFARVLLSDGKHTTSEPVILKKSIPLN